MTKIYKTLHRKQMIEQQLPHEEPGVTSSARRVTPIYFL